MGCRSKVISKSDVNRMDLFMSWIEDHSLINILLEYDVIWSRYQSKGMIDAKLCLVLTNHSDECHGSNVDTFEDISMKDGNFFISFVKICRKRSCFTCLTFRRSNNKLIITWVNLMSMMIDERNTFPSSTLNPWKTRLFLVSDFYRLNRRVFR